MFGLYILVRWGSAFLKPISCALKVAKYSCACCLLGNRPVGQCPVNKFKVVIQPQETIFFKQSSCMFHIFVLKALGLRICVNFELLECQEEFNIIKSVSKVNQWVSEAVVRVQVCHIKITQKSCV